MNKLYRLFTRSLFFRTSFLYLVNFGLFIMVYDLWEWMISSEIDKFFIVFSENYLFVMYFFYRLMFEWDLNFWTKYTISF